MATRAIRWRLGAVLGSVVSSGRPSPPDRVRGRLPHSPGGDLCVTRNWVPGRPLTDFGRRRPNLPLPLERVKSGDPRYQMAAWRGAGLGRLERKTLTPGSSPGQAPTLSPRRPLRNPKLGARKTPHRFPPRTAESASPLGEGEDPAPLRGRGGVLQRSPRGEGAKTAAHEQTGDVMQMSPWATCGRPSRPGPFGSSAARLTKVLIDDIVGAGNLYVPDPAAGAG